MMLLILRVWKALIILHLSEPQHACQAGFELLSPGGPAPCSGAGGTSACKVMRGTASPWAT
jgi:hypothetical protein